MTKPMLALLSAAALLAGCATSKPNAATDAAPVACNADAANSYVGQAGTEATIEAVRKATGATLVRPLKPGQAATMDYRVERVNVFLDAAGNIEKIGCG